MLDLIRATAVRKVYRTPARQRGAASRETVALEDIHLEVRDGELLALVGPSGCGKSTFLDIVAGLVQPDAGAVYLGDKQIDGPGLDRGLVFQGYALIPWKSVLDNVAFGLAAQGVPKTERHAIAERYVKLVGLTKFADRMPHELSGGMKQRVAIARALAFDPKVLLMDEPFGALDAQTRERLQLELLRITRETHKTVLFVTHSIDEAVLLADRIAVMTSRPGTIKAVIDVQLPPDRLQLGDAIRSLPAFLDARDQVWRHLKSEVDKAAELEASA
ncbi:MAG: ABC transporter ATP-binding protein [Polyangiales bacterium]